MKPLLSVEVIRNLEQAAVLFHPLRIRILGGLSEAASAAKLARELGIPRQKVNYHLRELEKQRLVREVEVKRRGNCVERTMIATARSYVISPEALGGVGAEPEQVKEEGPSAYLVALAADAIRGATEGASGGERTIAHRAEVSLASEEDASDFADELAHLVQELAGNYNNGDPSEEKYTFITGVYPAGKATGR